MSATYWIKLYHEILEDPKMALLPDNLWRRIVELFLLAGKHNDNGALPDTKILAWELRIPAEQLDAELAQIVATGIIERTESGWKIRNFEKRQAPSTNAERVRNFRERERVTHEKRNVTQNVTENVTNEKRKMSPDTEADTDTEVVGASNKLSSPAVAAAVVADATGLPAIPPTEYQRVDQVCRMIDAYGKDKVTEAMKQASGAWKETKRAGNRGTYSITNFGWVDWAMEYLSTGRKTWAQTIATEAIYVPD